MFTLVGSEFSFPGTYIQASLASVQGPGVANMPSSQGGGMQQLLTKGHFGLHGSPACLLGRGHIRVCHSLGTMPRGPVIPSTHEWRQGNSQSRRACVLFDLRNLEAFRTWKCSPRAMQCGGRGAGL